MVAIVIEIDQASMVSTAHVAVGACAERSQRLALVETALRGLHVGVLGDFVLADGVLASLVPIGDVRASAPFRLHAAKVLLEEAIHDISRELNP
jgi:CO/xanthine dehydrogenase FAD-binding subunit